MEIHLVRLQAISWFNLVHLISWSFITTINNVKLQTASYNNWRQELWPVTVQRTPFMSSSLATTSWFEYYVYRANATREEAPLVPISLREPTEASVYTWCFIQSPATYFLKVPFSKRLLWRTPKMILWNKPSGVSVVICVTRRIAKKKKSTSLFDGKGQIPSWKNLRKEILSTELQLRGSGGQQPWQSCIWVMKGS